MTDCFICSHEQLPDSEAAVPNATWVCTCGTVYRLVFIPGEGQRWALGADDKAAENPALDKDQLEKVISGYLRLHGAEHGSGGLAETLRAQFALKPPVESFRVELRVEVPALRPEQTQVSVRDRVAEYLAGLTAVDFSRSFWSVERLNKWSTEGTT